MDEIRKGQRFTVNGIRYEAIADSKLDAVAAVMVPSSIHSPTHWVALADITRVTDTVRSRNGR